MQSDFPGLGRVWITLPTLVLAIGLFTKLSANESIAKAATAWDTNPLEGVWLADSAMSGDRGLLGWVWTSKFVVKGNSFDISHVYDASKDLHLHGTFSLPPKGSPHAIDLDVDEFDMSATGEPVKYPHCLLRGLYKIENDRLTICVFTSQEAQRPGDFQPHGNEIVLQLVRAGPGFKEFPRNLTLAVKDPQGNPAAGASVCHYMYFLVRGAPDPNEAPPTWKYQEIARTDAAGIARVDYRESDIALARDPAHHLIGVTDISPASVLESKVTVQLQPECTLRGTIVCDALTQAKKPIGWTNVLLYQDGRRLAQCSSREGAFEFPVPQGHYTLMVYGENVQKQYVHVAVASGERSIQLSPISAQALNLPLLVGKPAPELRAVIGWKGTPVKLSELKGKLVLLDFWGYWCGPCVAEMPTLIELHERYHDQGLAIIGVHVDVDGEIDTAARLDEKIAALKRDHWHGKDLPFPVALMSGREHTNGQKVQGALADYGIEAYPTTILIDREGNVVGSFDASNVEKASAEIDKLLKAK